MSDPELNARIARLMGYVVEPLGYTPERYGMKSPDGRSHGLLYPSDEDVWRLESPDYSGDPNACAELRKHLYRDGKYGSSIDFNMNLWEGLYRFRVRIEHDPIDGDCDEYEEAGDTEEEACARACADALEALAKKDT